MERRVTWFVVALATCAAVAVVTCAFLVARAGVSPTALAPAALVALAFFLVLRYAGALVVSKGEEGTAVSFEEVVVYASLVILPPAVAPLAILPGSLLDQRVAKRPLVKGAFNASNSVLAVSLSALSTVPLTAAGAPAWLAAVPAAFVYPAAIEVSLARLFSLIDGVPFRSALTRESFWSTTLTATTSAILGVGAVALYSLHPLLVLVLAPAFWLARRFVRLASHAHREVAAFQRMAASERALVGVADETRVATEVAHLARSLFVAGRVEISLGEGERPRAWSADHDLPVHGTFPSMEHAIAPNGTIRVWPSPAATVEFGPEDRTLLASVAAHAGLALANARALREEAARSAREANLAAFGHEALAMRSDDEVARAADALVARAFGVPLPPPAGLGASPWAPRGLPARALAPDESELVARVGYVVETAVQRIRAERALRDSEKLSTLGTLVAGVAHEIGNPLTSVSLSIDLLGLQIQGLADSAQDADVRAQLAALRADQETVKKGVDRIAEITQSLKRVGRRGLPGRAAEDVNEIVRNVALVTEARLGPGTHLVTRLAASSKAFVNAGEISQAVLNLALNAADALREKGGTIEIATRDTPTGCEVLVRDDGPGIPEDVRAKLFTAFYTTKREGTGLGLSLSRKLAEENGGKLELLGESGRGAAFSLTLPSAASEPPAPRRAPFQGPSRS